MDIKHKQIYFARDSYTDMIKIGAASNVKHRLGVISNALGRHLELLYSTPGSDYFLTEIPLSRATHPEKHDGYHEWYNDTPEVRAFLAHIISISATLDVTRIVTETWMHKYTV